MQKENEGLAIGSQGGEAVLWKIGLALVALWVVSFILKIATTIITILVVLVMGFYLLRHLKKGPTPPKG